MGIKSKIIELKTKVNDRLTKMIDQIKKIVDPKTMITDLKTKLNNIKMRKYLLWSFYALFGVLLLTCSVLMIIILSSLGKPNRYVLSHATLSDVGVEYSDSYNADEVSKADTDEYAASENVTKPEKDTFFQRLADVNLVLSTVFSNLNTGFKGIVSVEAGTVLNSETLSAAAGQQIEPVTDLSSIPTDEIGYYRVTLRSDDITRKCMLIITDSEAPLLRTKTKKLYVGDTPGVKDFIKSAEDKTALEFYFVTEPNCDEEGETDFIIAAKDRGGNITTVELSCEVKTDTEPPVISGVRDRVVYIGENVLYKDGVTVYDNRDGSDVKLNIDISAVDSSAEGKYPVIYSATDSTGLTSTARATFTFKYAHDAIVMKELDELVQPLIEKIIEDDWTQRQKAQAIYVWVQRHIVYVANHVKPSWYESALKGLQTHRGDCYTFASVSKALLDAAGIENIYVEREYTPNQPNREHYWNMVKIDGEWYHFDSTVRMDGITLFLLTNSQMLSFSSRHSDSNYFDPSKYPETP